MTQDPVERLTARYDHHDPEFTPDVVDAVHRRLQETSPVVHSAAHGGMWLLSRYRDVKAVLRDHETFSSAAGVFFPRAPGTPKFAPLDYDRPEHTALRSLMIPPLARDNVRRLTDPITAIAAESLAPLADRGYGDLATDVAMPLAIRTVAHSIGLSERARLRIRDLTRNLWRHLPTDSGPDKFWPPFTRMFAEEIATARAHPRDDHLSWLANAELHGRPITDEELHAVLVSYCLPGHETTMNAINHLLWHLARSPETQRRLRTEPDLIPAAAEEAVRLWTPVSNHSRVTTRDTVVRDTAIPEGARVMLLVAAANRDPDHFDDAEAFRLDRGVSPHLGFGFGIHYCIGAHLARLEIQILLRQLTRLPDYHLTEPPQRHIENGRHIVIDHLPVRFGDAGH